MRIREIHARRVSRKLKGDAMGAMPKPHPGPNNEPSLHVVAGGDKKPSPIPTIAMLVLFYPIGLAMMWTKRVFSQRTRIAVTAAFGVVTFIGLASPKAKTPPVQSATAGAPTAKATGVAETKLSAKANDPQPSKADAVQQGAPAATVATKFDAAGEPILNRVSEADWIKNVTADLTTMRSFVSAVESAVTKHNGNALPKATLTDLKKRSAVIADIRGKYFGEVIPPEKWDHDEQNLRELVTLAHNLTLDFTPTLKFPEPSDRFRNLPGINIGIKHFKERDAKYRLPNDSEGVHGTAEPKAPDTKPDIDTALKLYSANLKTALKKGWPSADVHIEAKPGLVWMFIAVTAADWSTYSAGQKKETLNDIMIGLKDGLAGSVIRNAKLKITVATPKGTDLGSATWSALSSSPEITVN